MIEKTHDSDDDDDDGFAVPTSRTAASMRNPRIEKGSLTALDNAVKRNMEQSIILKMTSLRNKIKAAVGGGISLITICALQRSPLRCVT